MRLVKKVIGSNIARLRERAKLRQAELAEKMGVEVPTVSRWENGHIMPDDKKMDLLLDILKANEEDLLLRTPVSPEEAASNLLKEAAILARFSQNKELSPEEQELLRLWNSLSIADRDSFLPTLRQAASRDRHKAKNNPKLSRG